MHETFKRYLAISAISLAGFVGTSALREMTENSYRDDVRACEIQSKDTHASAECKENLGDNYSDLYGALAVAALAASIVSGLRAYQANNIATAEYIARQGSQVEAK